MEDPLRIIKMRVISVDIGATNVRVALSTCDGKIVAKKKELTRTATDAKGVLTHIGALINSVAPNLEDVIGIAIGVPGPIDPWTGKLYEAWNLPELFNTPLKPFFEENLRVPVFFANDAHLAALGEHRFGAGRGVQNMVYMTISTGIGGGIIIDNHRLLGVRGLACEVGEQVFANPEGGPATEVKSLETLASGPNIAKHAIALLRQGRNSLIREMVDELEEITGETVTSAARDGDSLAKEVLSWAGFYIGLALTNLIHIFNPELIVLGGGVLEAGDDLLQPVKETIHKYTMTSVLADVRITRAKLGDDAGLLGGVALVLEERGKRKAKLRRAPIEK